jgi:hypothetical protein
MNPRVKLVVLSRYRDIFHDFKTIVNALEPEIPKLLVRSGEEIQPQETLGWSVVQGDEPFVYAKNANLGWRITGYADVILCGDDVKFETPFVDELQRTAYLDDKVGVSTVQFYGQSPFVCGYFKRSVLNAVGELDENFTGYGAEDMQWCDRMEALGYRTLPTDKIKAVHHGGTSFWRRAAEKGIPLEVEANYNNALLAEQRKKK